MADPQTIEPSYWEDNLPGENDVWFRRFRTYLLMPRRSILGAFQLEETARGQQKKAVRVPGAWNISVDKFDWKSRVKAYDDNLYREQEIQYKEWKNQAIAQLQADVDLCSIKSTEMLARSLDQETISEDGMTITRQPAKWTMADAIRAKTVAKDLLLAVVALREPEVDLVQAIKRFIEEGLLDPGSLGEVQEGWEDFKGRMKTLRLNKSEMENVESEDAPIEE